MVCSSFDLFSFQYVLLRKKIIKEEIMKLKTFGFNNYISVTVFFFLKLGV